ncbi:hypothetical protein K439DRAFT_1614804 [Ramaria rubella]|nr:hypothetical protein K439DRAFT_1614804 [Ramaria rubella]
MTSTSQPHLSSFLTSKWIGIRKTYPRWPSHKVRHEREHLLTVPHDISCMIPDKLVTVAKLIRTPDLPRLDELEVHWDPYSCFSEEPPIADTASIVRCSIPPMLFLVRLLNAFGQAWFDGKQSLVDWWEETPTTLPFWVLTYWSDFACVLSGCCDWILAERWLLAQQKDGQVEKLVKEACGIFQSINWNSPMQGPTNDMDTLDLSQLLGKWLINCKVVDAIFSLINERVQLADLSNSVEVTKLNIIHGLR